MSLGYRGVENCRKSLAMQMGTMERLGPVVGKMAILSFRALNEALQGVTSDVG